MSGADSIKVSVIVPVYNTGKLLEKCIGSILDQSLIEIEVIIVDDGSTDESKELCDSLAKKDERVRVIHKKNEGVSIARNTGIQAAQGEYIGFVDSDDWVDVNMYSDLYSESRKHGADIVMCDATTKYDDKPDEPDTITQLSGSCVLEKTEIYPSLLMEMAGAAWRCIYKRELIIGSRVEFPSGIKLAEDRIFNILAFGYANKLAYIKKSYYNRFVRKGSAVNKYYPDMLDVILKARTGVMDALDTAWDGSEEYKDTYENQTVAHSLAAINNEFYKDARGSFSQRYKKIKKLCSTPEIRKAIQITNRDDVRLKLIIKRRVLPLCAVAIILNKKHGR